MEGYGGLGSAAARPDGLVSSYGYRLLRYAGVRWWQNGAFSGYWCPGWCQEGGRTQKNARKRYCSLAS